MTDPTIALAPGTVEIIDVVVVDAASIQATAPAATDAVTMRVVYGLTPNGPKASFEAPIPLTIVGDEPPDIDELRRVAETGLRELAEALAIALQPGDE